MSDDGSVRQAQPLAPIARCDDFERRFVADPVGLFAELAQQEGPVFRLSVGGRDTVFLNDSQTAEKMLRLDFSSFGMSQQVEELNRPLLGRSMPVVADHRYWEELHAILLPMFTPPMVRGYFEQT